MINLKHGFSYCANKFKPNLYFKTQQSSSVKTAISTLPLIQTNRSFSQNILTKKFTFPPTAKIVGRHPGLFATDTMLRETDFFAANVSFFLKHCGPIQRFFIYKLLDIPYVKEVFEGQHPHLKIVIDSRTHTLKIAEQPAIPGWHTDFAERTSENNMQPDYSKITPALKTYVVNYSNRSGGVSNTEILNNSVSLELPKVNVYESIDKQLLNMPFLDRQQLEDGEIIQMDQLSLHRGMEAHNEGVRGFIRFAILHDLSTTILQDKIPNETRNQLQSYRDMYIEFESRHRLQKHLLKKHYEFNAFSRSGPDHKEFNSARLPEGPFSINQIKQEVMIINGDLSFCKRYGGPLTQKFLEAMEEHPVIKTLISNGERNLIKINTRVHMLMKGQSPDLGMWRSGAPFQEVIHPDESKLHLYFTLSTKQNGVSHLELINEYISYINDSTPSLNAIQRSIDNTKYPTDKIGDNTLISFSGGTLSRALPAHDSGWRLTVLISIDSRFIQNQIVKQTPVYLENISLGW